MLVYSGPRGGGTNDGPSCDDAPGLRA
jgi:hypothetical protein